MLPPRELRSDGTTVDRENWVYLSNSAGNLDYGYMRTAGSQAGEWDRTTGTSLGGGYLCSQNAPAPTQQNGRTVKWHLNCNGPHGYHAATATAPADGNLGCSVCTAAHGTASCTSPVWGPGPMYGASEASAHASTCTCASGTPLWNGLSGRHQRVDHQLGQLHWVAQTLRSGTPIVGRIKQISPLSSLVWCEVG